MQVQQIILTFTANRVHQQASCFSMHINAVSPVIDNKLLPHNIILRVLLDSPKSINKLVMSRYTSPLLNERGGGGGGGGGGGTSRSRN